jgi:Flp pilus assembly protein TadG
MSTEKTPSRRSRSRGQGLIYVIVAMPIMCGFCSLAVDFGRAEVTKTELLRAADAAARYGAKGLSLAGSSNTATSYAQTAAAANTADGSSVVLQSSDVVTGTWNSSTGTFTAGGSTPTAVQVTAQRTAARGNAVATMFAAVIGCKTIDVHSTAVAVFTAGSSTTINVSGKADPWLAGMPTGTTANYTNQGWTDSAPSESPVEATATGTGITLTAGKAVQFKFTGSVSYYPGTQPFDPDGDPGWLIDNYYAAGQSNNAEHGIANITAPLTSVIGVFLDGNQPDSPAAGPAPAALDFSSLASQNFSTLSPQLKQPFFIGDGLMQDGVTLQNFIVPAGATRLYIGVMDGQQWSDNSGSLSTTVTKPTVITSVK